MKVVCIALLVCHGYAAVFRSAGPPQSASVTKEGFKIYYDPTQAHAAMWENRYATWEPQTFAVFQRLQKDKVVLDVGGWIGLTALWSAHVAKKVFVLEPTQKAFGELEANLQLNTEVRGKVVAINAGLGASDRVANMTNNGDSMDKFTSLIDIKVVSIASLRKEHPELDKTGFVKIDTEGYEKVIVPALKDFFKETKAAAYVSLHPVFIGHSDVQGVVDVLKDTFPYLYESDMKTPFNTSRSSYGEGDHAGTDVVGVWEKL